VTTPTDTQLDGNPAVAFAQVFRPAPQNSIEFARNAKGEPSWTVKLYFTEGAELETITRMGSTDNMLAATFKPRWAALPTPSETAEAA
jgi:hypothetical protein